MLEEIPPNASAGVEINTGEKSHPTGEVNLLNASAKWSEEISEPTLSKVSATLASGQLLAVVGPVGAGKVGKK
jgi:ABC-type multidrug transport system fused ATPase/permease subunit